MTRWSVPAEVHGHGRFLRRRRDFVPAYLQAHEAGRLKEKVEQALAHLGPSCTVCPRLCKGVDRRVNQVGVCRVGRHALVSSAFPHFGEEDVLRGWAGSGTIFFSLCNLKCVFCQNHDISQAPAGAEVDARQPAPIQIGREPLSDDPGCANQFERASRSARKPKRRVSIAAAGMMRRRSPNGEVSSHHCRKDESASRRACHLSPYSLPSLGAWPIAASSSDIVRP